MRGKILIAMVFSLGALGITSGAWPADAPAPGMEVQTSQRAAYLIGVGDNLEVTVWKNPDVSRRVWVRPDGRITLPLIGELVAEGLSAQDLARVVAGKLKEYLTDPVVTISLETMGTTTALPVRTTPKETLPPAEVRPTGTPGDSASYRIGVEDVLDITVWRNPDVSRQVWVRPDGKAALPLIGEFQAEGLSPQALAADLGNRLKAFYADPVVSVGVVEINSYTVYVMGLVRTPGVQKFRSPRTFLQVLSMAGGFQEFADSGNVAVLRWEDGKQKRIPVDAKKIIAKGTESDFLMKPGDVVVVP